MKEGSVSSDIIGFKSLSGASQVHNVQSSRPGM